jgi:hypothetical protein
MLFSNHIGNSGKYDKRNAHHPRKCVSSMEETLRTVYRQYRGLL